MKIFCIVCLLSIAACNPAAKKKGFKIIDVPKEEINEVVLVGEKINYKDPIKMFFIITGFVVFVPLAIKLLSRN